MSNKLQYLIEPNCVKLFYKSRIQFLLPNRKLFVDKRAF
jgi:hypothetical protein